MVNCHAEGEVGDVIVGGVAPPPGTTLWEQSRWIANDRNLRNLTLNEPRGGICRHVNLLVPAKHPRAQMGWIIMEPEDTPPMSGSNSICVATVLLETGILAMREPVTRLVLEAPGGLVEAAAQCGNSKARQVTIRNVPSFADRLSADLEVAGLKSLKVDTAYGGDSFVVVKAHELGFAVRPDEARELVDTGLRITAAANEQIGFAHPENPQWRHISFCLFEAPLEKTGGRISGRNAVVVRPGKIDRSPTGTGISARMALMRARGAMAAGDEFTARSIIGSEFHGRIVADTEVAGRPAIVPEFTGRAWITGTQQLMLDPDDPWPDGYRVADTWPGCAA